MTPSMPGRTPSFPSTPPIAVGEERSIGELFSQLADETGTLVRKEMQLAKVEMTEKAKAVGKDSALLGVGGAVAYVGFMALIASAVLALGSAIPYWLSALIIGAGVVVVGAVMAQVGASKMKRLDAVPHDTVRSLKEDKRLVTREVKR